MKKEISDLGWHNYLIKFKLHNPCRKSINILKGYNNIKCLIINAILINNHIGSFKSNWRTILSELNAYRAMPFHYLGLFNLHLPCNCESQQQMRNVRTEWVLGKLIVWASSVTSCPCLYRGVSLTIIWHTNHFLVKELIKRDLKMR